MTDTATPSTSLSDRLSRMASALEAEIAYIKKTSGEQKLELTSGWRVGRTSGPGGV